jgi:hypothetical protein
MKESEMVKAMAEHWLGLLREESPGNMNISEDIFEEIQMKMRGLLYSMEYKGMQPPKYKNYHPSSGERIWSRDGDWGWDGYDDKGNKITWLECEGWEPE